MRKTILTPTDAGLLIPHWYEINPQKVSRLHRAHTRMSRHSFGQRSAVMDTPAILIDNEGYILNGRHRPYLAAKQGQALEAIIVSGPGEIKFQVPRESFGDVSVEQLVEALDNKQTYIAACQAQGIFCINDLVRLY